MNRWTKTVFIVGILAIGIGWQIEPLWRQEGNPLPLFNAALRLTLSSNPVELVDGDTNRYLLKARYGLGPFIDMMAAQGWTYQEQMGAGIVFYRDGLGLTALSRMYTSYFMIIDLPSFDEPPLPADTACVTLTAAGDILMHNTVIESGHINGGYDYSQLYAPVKGYLEAADYASVNLETALAGPGGGYTGYPRFNSPDQIAPALKDCGFDLVVTANNHILDRGIEGAERTIGVLHQAGLDTIGTNLTAGDRDHFLVKEIRGIRVGYLAYSYGTNGMPLSQDHDYFFNYLDKETVLRDIAALRPQVDVLVLVLHWGVEYSPLPSPEQRAWARDFLSEGADVILGSHPHVIQPLEVMTIDGKEKLVIYSMGNSMGDQDGIERNIGVIMSLQFTKDLKSGQTTLSGYSYIPTYINEYFEHGRRMFRLLSLDDAIESVSKRQDSYLGPEDLPKLVKLRAQVDEEITRALPQ